MRRRVILEVLSLVIVLLGQGAIGFALGWYMKPEVVVTITKTETVPSVKIKEKINQEVIADDQELPFKFERL